MIWKILLFAIILVGISMAGIAIKMFIKKDGEFKKSCGTTDPKTGEKLGCACGNPEGDSCVNKVEVEKVNL